MLEPHPVYNHPVIEQEAASSHAAVEEPPQAQEAPHSPEEGSSGFALTPDGEEHFGAPADTAMMASLIDYHNAPVEVQMGLDSAMSDKWQKYTEFNAVVPCTEQVP